MVASHLKKHYLQQIAITVVDVEIFEEAAVVKRALFQIASHVHDNLSQSQHMFSSDCGSGSFCWCLWGYKGDAGDWSRKGGAIINQIRPDSGANIKVDSSAIEGDDCLIIISTKEFFDDSFSPTIEVVLWLQPRYSKKVERKSRIISFTTRLLVPTPPIGCLIGKGGTTETEMRRLTKVNICILSKENLYVEEF
ncbi:hypothetical protein Fmac_011157 [Flemingia macrophylla]|uniref:K Homology domain-containing protein n=1 Tax=Flemingia macrophylla TaxID=520843 RepID=A0ABD1MLM4_9FABA